jgi:hypothetical protein
VVRTADGNLVVSESLVLEIGFKANLSSPVFLYRESHNTQTNAYGQVSVQIGNGTILNGALNTIDWSNGTVTFEAVATINGSNLVISQQQLSSVPYALFATRALSLSGPDDLDNTNEIQSLNLTGNILGISGHPGTVNLSSLLDNTDNQTLSLNNTNLSITGGNSVDLAPLIANVDTSPSNEIQHLSLTQVGLTGTLQLSQSPISIDLTPYLGTNTDHQTLSILNNSLSITNGNSVDLNPYLQNAGQVPYNNATSGISATTAQAALDEIVSEKPDNLQEAYSGGSTVQLNATNEFRVRSNAAAPILSTSNSLSGIGIGIETPQHKLHVEGSTLLTVHPGFDAFEALTSPGTFEIGELHYFTEGNPANHSNIAVANIMTGSGLNYGSMDMAQGTSASINTGSYGFATGASAFNVGVRGNVTGTVAGSNNYGMYGYASGTGQNNYGLRAFGDGGASIGNFGLRGDALGTAPNSYGVFGTTSGTGASNYGTYGRAIGAGTINYGIYGTASGGTTNFAGYFDGNVSIVSGTLEVSTISSSGATVSINDNLSVSGTFTTTGNVTIPNAASLEVTNLASVGSTVNINDNLSTTGNVTSGGNISVQGSLLKGSTQLIDVRNESVYAGASAGLSNVGGTFRNIGIGYGTLPDHTTGPDNIAVGAYALNDNTTSNNNIAIGSYAADGIISSSDHNVAIGTSSLSSITTNHSFNTALGSFSMESITSGSGNVAIGFNAMNSNNSAGIHNVAVGTSTLNNINNGNDNVVVGEYAGANIDTENSNVLLGAYANTVGDVQNGVAIGFQATVAQNDAIILGNVTNPNIRVGIGTNTPTEKLSVVGNTSVSGTVTASTLTQTSDKRLKENIRPLEIDKVLSIINSIDTYQYTWKSDTLSTDKKLQYGVIAQELEKILPSIVHTDTKGFKSVNYTALIPFLLEAIKSQQQKIDALQKSNDGLQTLIEKELSALAVEVKMLRTEKSTNTEKP